MFEQTTENGTPGGVFKAENGTGRSRPDNGTGLGAPTSVGSIPDYFGGELRLCRFLSRTGCSVFCRLPLTFLVPVFAMNYFTWREWYHI